MRLAPVLPLFLVLSSGCIGELVPLVSNGPDGGVGSGGGDAGVALKFDPDIESDLDSNGCTAVCHEMGGPGTVKMTLMRSNAASNYGQIHMKAMNGDQSVLLTNGLPGSTHTGGIYFPGGTNNALYVRWLSWIVAGAPQQ